VKLRPRGTPAECQAAAHRLAEAFDVVHLSGPSPDRSPSSLVRADLELRLHPAAAPPAAPAGPGQQPQGGPR
jgi:hypothetical protein